MDCKALIASLLIQSFLKFNFFIFYDTEFKINALALFF